MLSAHLPTRRRALSVLAVLLTLAGLVSAQSITASARATAVTTTVTSNPLAAHASAVDRSDDVYKAYLHSTGTNRQLLARIAGRPRVRWIGDWVPAAKMYSWARSYISTVTGGNPNYIVQLAVFRIFPGGESRSKQPMTAAQQADYKAWINNLARGIGSSRVALILEPDLAVALKGWQPAVRLSLVRYAAQKLSALPNTDVYLDAGSADWLTADQAAHMLKSAGVYYARGFALNATHYDSTSRNVFHGYYIVKDLNKLHDPNKHFVINTADTGRPFTFGQYFAKHPHGNFDNAETCTSRSEQHCVTLGIPPTTHVADLRWGLVGPLARKLAAAYVDAYLWFGRPWLYNQSNPFSLTRALAVARTTPYA